MKEKNKHILVAMSGGVDSTVAAALLLAQGHQVSGVTMRVWDTEPLGDGREPAHIRDARKVAFDLGIPLHVVDLREEFLQQVVTPFCEEYLSGRTPNPCVLCNRVFKFSRLLREADRLGADALATGHYARIVEHDGLKVLAKGSNRQKDQSYFLFTLTQQQLQRVVFPLGEMSKEEVRTHAERLGLHVAQKGDSQDICFIPDGDYIGFLERQSHATDTEGSIVHVSGKRLGKHRGAYRFTVGQRRGLGIAWPEPLYVVAIDAAKKQVIVGEKEHLHVDRLVTTGTNWIVAQPQQPLQARCRIRYRHQEAPCTLVVLGNDRVEVRFDEPQSGVSPGQAAVFYDEDRVLGGGWIA
ncbi:tRNA (5-carboxymethylaminomethyl-2-thio-U34)-thioltransferase [Syntrophotalea carbinolica DSM 2380]|uniref:tRNA-specific 2-thiouridylase MnmA n=1 Tax=Syntrophotalea carbinolica (strain DSM 2380 / NBRC 103641 / GraBd1) TaxID=338963 RepID=MNMA_SYNC1|nr:tRNA 2-thiouridine(34) synthase MnmA [Syntrophotalea carbinolica]Q3A3F8.1 RecName: Full=tRNA-specific 2-thiouridylase MnmA [Syntrophotalea carbinolica DSM 2380]ABA89099.1 tRNA (5-carboxymethylaminomethyl-2-thio-U34)-thioltransferase [Syntrophotalea carbinolica DSM 2380]